MSNNILDFLRELKYSFPNAGKVFTEGSCFRLYKILKTVYKNAQPLYSQKEGHWITKIDGKYYDINGEIDKEYVNQNFLIYKEEDIICQSAYVPTYKGQCTSYSKYKRAV